MVTKMFTVSKQQPIRIGALLAGLSCRLDAQIFQPGGDVRRSDGIRRPFAEPCPDRGDAGWEIQFIATVPPTKVEQIIAKLAHRRCLAENSQLAECLWGPLRRRGDNALAGAF